VEEVGRIAAERGTVFLVDVAQSLGHVPVDVRRIGCQLLAAPGHKGLLGPLGTGLLYVAPGIEDQLMPLRQGGTGTRSDEDVQPTSLPDRYESGNLNVPGIIGLAAGLSEIKRHGLESIERHSRELTRQLLNGLANIGGLTLYGPRNVERRLAVVSFNLAGFDPQELASLLDANWSIQTRAGLHCAPRMHAALGTAPSGTLRVSLGHSSTAEDVNALLAALAEIAA
jgi:selenocysteine lyase/cysteine desulfurase